MEIDAFHLAVLFVAIITPLLLIRPKSLTYLYLGLLLYMPNTLAFGVKRNVEYLDFYGAGTGVYVRSLISLYLLGVFVVCLFTYRDKLRVISGCQSFKILSILSIYYLGYALFGLLSGFSLEEVISGNSAIHLVDMTLFMFVLLKFCSEEKDFTNLTYFLIFCVASREVFGLIRYFLFNGDFSNVYLNVEKIKIKLTFQDINDSLLGCLAGYYCAWQLMFNRNRLGRMARFLYLVVVALALFTIMFSFRRSAWLGLLLASSWFVLKQPFRRQIQISLVVASIMAITFSKLLTMRLGKFGHNGLSLFIHDILGKQGEITMKSGRFTELNGGINAIKENPIFGIGPWGSFGPFGKDFMHGGILQIWLKLGFIGEALFVAAILAFVFYYFVKTRELLPEDRGWFESGFAGFLFMVPTFSIGTPIIEYRTMQLTALCLALPYMAHAIYKERAGAMNGPVS
jgi:O-antigen ligase